jgi:hypothetical protein
MMSGKNGMEVFFFLFFWGGGCRVKIGQGGPLRWRNFDWPFYVVGIFERLNSIIYYIYEMRKRLETSAHFSNKRLDR